MTSPMSAGNPGVDEMIAVHRGTRISSARRSARIFYHQTQLAKQICRRLDPASIKTHQVDRLYTLNHRFSQGSMLPSAT